jgi:hypothetical protein
MILEVGIDGRLVTGEEGFFDLLFDLGDLLRLNYPKGKPRSWLFHSRLLLCLKLLGHRNSDPLPLWD